MIGEVGRLCSPEQSLVFLTLANLLYVVCYGVRDVLWLRIFCVTAMLTIMPYYLWGTQQPQLNCIAWNVLFLAINLFWIVVIIRQRRPPKMTPQEKRLFENVFARSCSAQEMLQLLSVAKKISCESETELIAQGDDTSQLILIQDGHALVETGMGQMTRLGSGEFAGELCYMTGLPAVTSFVADTDMEYYHWHAVDLENLFRSAPELKAALHDTLARGLTRKMTMQQIDSPEMSITMLVKDM